MRNKINNKTKQLHLRLSEAEYDKLHLLSKDYPSVSAFVLDACWHFNSKRNLKIIEYVEEKANLFSSFKSEINRTGNNINQLVQYTNTCIKLGVYLPNTSDEIIRLQGELYDLMKEVVKQTKDLENKYRSALRRNVI